MIYLHFSAYLWHIYKYCMHIYAYWMHILCIYMHILYIHFAYLLCWSLCNGIYSYLLHIYCIFTAYLYKIYAYFEHICIFCAYNLHICWYIFGQFLQSLQVPGLSPTACPCLLEGRARQGTREIGGIQVAVTSKSVQGITTLIIDDDDDTIASAIWVTTSVPIAVEKLAEL